MADRPLLRWSWPAAIAAGVGALIGVFAGQLLFTVGWHRTLTVGLFAGFGVVLGQMLEARRSGPTP